MFSMNQARYSTVIFLRGLCKFAISTTATTSPFSIENFPKTHHERSPLRPQKKSTHTPEVYRKIIHRNWKFTHKKNIRRKLIMTSTSSKLKYYVQKTTIHRDDGLRIYYFAYMKSPPLFRVPSILRSCYSNYELKKSRGRRPWSPDVDLKMDHACPVLGRIATKGWETGPAGGFCSE